MRYTVIQPIKHDGVRTAPGGHIDLSAKAAERLLQIGAIEPDRKAAADKAAADQAADDKAVAEQAEKDAAEAAAAHGAAAYKKADSAPHGKGR